MKVLVMGGTQFNGLALVRELMRTGHDVTILNRGQTDAPLPRGVKRLYADRTDHDAMRQVLGGQEFDCIHDVSAYRPEDVQLMVELFRGRVGHYIFASSTVIYEPSNVLPITEDFPLDRSPNQIEYGMNKILCEDYLVEQYREHGFPMTIAAFSMVFGPRNIIPDREQRMFMRILKGRKVMIPGDGTTLGQVGHVDDQARALRLLMANPKALGRRYNITGGDCYSDEGYVDTFARILERDVEKVFVPADMMDDLYAGRIIIQGGGMRSLVDTRAQSDARVTGRFRVGRLVQRIAPNLHDWNRSVLFGVERLKQDTGWQPEYTFPAAVEQTWDWMLSEGLDETLDFDFGFEDDLLAEIGRRSS